MAPVVNCQFVHSVGSCHALALMLGAVTASEPTAGWSIARQTSTPPGEPVRTAAFFDLDKTVIAKSSTLAFSKPFFDQGLINRRAVLKSTYAQFLFLMSGADHDQMDRMRSYITNMCTGWDVEQVKSIVGETLHDIVDPLVFADGRYTGEIAFYCYGEGKVEAIRQLAAREGYALEHCYAYSDSITDLPMLEAVGHPTVVNPDRALRKEAAARGWPVLTFSRPVSLRDRIPAPSGAAIATSAAVGISALAAGAVTYSLLRRYAF